MEWTGQELKQVNDWKAVAVEQDGGWTDIAIVEMVKSFKIYSEVHPSKPDDGSDTQDAVKQR